MNALFPASRESAETRARLYSRIEAAIGYLQTHQADQPDLDAVAAHVGMSPYHLQRTFSEWAGVSPKKFLKSLTLSAAKESLRGSASVLDASFEAGLSGPGRLHDLFVSTDAVTPGEYKSHGAGMTFNYGFHPSPFGDCLVVMSSRGLSGLSFVTESRNVALAEQKNGWEAAVWRPDQDTTAKAAAQIFDPSTPNDFSLLLRGTPFRVKVWEALLRIPEGAVVSYGDLADHLDQPKSARAVASAVATNLLGYVIPCHRVIRESGALAGYRWGIARKSAILGMESMNFDGRMTESHLESRDPTP